MKITLTLLTIATGSTYLIFRLSDLIQNPMIMGSLFFCLELFISICYLFYWRILLRGSSIVTSKPDILNVELPMIDILIPTLNEDLNILSKTIEAACLIDGNKNIYVLDDGKRDWLKSHCDEKGIFYIRREGRDHAKAGNLNHALKHIKSEFALILDADVLPSPDILSTAIPHFTDSTVAVVQFPQEFSNTDSFQHWEKGKLWHDFSFGSNTVNPYRNFMKASYWIGSPSIIRTEAFKQIGGVQTGSVTEDVQTTIALMAEGFWVKSLSEVKAISLAPHDYEAYCIQRQRWSKGFFQVWWSKQSPLRKKISFSAKMGTLGDFFYHFHISFYFLLIQIFPFIAVYNEEDFFHGSDKVLILWPISFILLNITNRTLGGPLFRLVPIQVYLRLSMFPTILGFIESLPICRNDVFEVTPKTRALKLKTRTLIYILLFIALLTLNLVSFSSSLLRLSENGFTVTLLFLTSWSILNLSYLSIGLVKIVTNHKKQ